MFAVCYNCGTRHTGTFAVYVSFAVCQEARHTANMDFAVCCVLCRVLTFRHTAKATFAVCPIFGTRQSLRHTATSEFPVVTARRRDDRPWSYQASLLVFVIWNLHMWWITLREPIKEDAWLVLAWAPTNDSSIVPPPPGLTANHNCNDRFKPFNHRTQWFLTRHSTLSWLVLVFN